MTLPMAGVRVVDLAAWTFVPAAGAVLAEWGADVIKVEHPQGGDPQRGLISSGLIPGGPGRCNYLIEQPNHNKRSIAIDVKHPRGREILLDLCRTADVFLTNWLPGPRTGRASRPRSGTSPARRRSRAGSRRRCSSASAPARPRSSSLSLLSLGTWMMSPNIVAHKVFADIQLPTFTRETAVSRIRLR